MKHLRAVVIMVLFAVLLVLSGCQKEQSPPTPPEVQGPTVLPEGDKFLTSGFKIKAEVKIKSSVSSDPLIFEVYVDKSGNGNGLVGYRDNVYDIYIVGDEVYVVVSGDTTVHITDITGHMIPHELLLSGATDLSAKGFTLLDGEVVTYTGGTGEVDMVTRYESSTSTFEPVSILQSNNMTSADLLHYFFKTLDTSYVEQPGEDEPNIERQSFYVNSDWGITIHDVTYSLGDFCEPYTYFEEMTPQGVNSTEDWREDVKVEIEYVSYISSDGMTNFMTTDGYVQAIATTSDFTFLDVLYRGMPVAELERLLGIGLKKDEVASFTPIREGMTATKINKGYRISYLDMTADLIVTDKNYGLRQVTLTNYLDFRS